MAATMRIEHVATTPRGYRVRSVKRGSHVVRVAFPPGRRHKGAGKVVEILHPKGESNPSCIVSNQARTNPGELIIFGNPSLTSSDERELTQLWHTARIAGAHTFGERIRWAAKEWDKTHPGQRMRAYKWLSSAMRGYNPSTQAAKRATRERAARIRGARLNPKRAELRKRIKALEAKFYPAMDRLAAARRAGGVMSPEYIAIEKETDKLSHDLDLARRLHGAAINPGKMTVDFDNARKQFRASMRHPDGGSYLYAWGHTKKQAAHALRDEWRAARRRNPFDWRESRQSGGAVVDSIRHGDRVTILTPQGQQRTGRAVMRSSSGGWVLNMGGPHGTPGLADERNIVHVRKSKGNPHFNPAMRVVFDGLIGKWLATIYHPKFGNLFSVGESKAEATAALKKQVADFESKRRTHNPKEHVGDHQGIAMYFEGISYNAPALKLYGYSTDLALKRAIDRKLKTRRNPVTRKRARNQDQTRAAVRLFEKFHGRDPKDITEKHVSAAMRKDYTALGDLEHLKVITPLGQTVQFNFEGDGVKLASSPDGKQLYCIGGNQNLSSCLDHASLEKDFIDLGECVQVQYLARKVHANFEPVSYYHKFGEKTGERPQLAYNKLQRQIFFVGGNYFIDTKQGVSPGIEN